ncbi:hypothetical protein FEM54_00770 [Pseudomonas edaphica]|uniref:Uncharacterized protein n=1 Tax=Pseudomonas edaphica TaxID=2006980 RepID=A0ABY2UC94_9PSED|nr:hypothetical protein [Pseudomonas edaphica]TLG94114.1 hypothetical protein FEM54_00770 [Pseudomonas edaphica]
MLAKNVNDDAGILSERVTRTFFVRSLAPTHFNKSKTMFKVSTSLAAMAAFLWVVPAAAQAKTCDALFGKFRIAHAPSGPGVLEVAQAVVDPEAEIGKPLFELYRDATSATWRHGLITGSRSPIDIQPTSKLAGTSCQAKLSPDASVVMFDFTRLSPEEATRMIDWLEQVWGARPSAEQLRDLRYLFAMDISMTGVMDASLFVPLERYENP